MKIKNPLLTATAAMLLFSSCQKDIIVKEEQDAINAEVSSDATVETSPAIWTSVRYNVNSNVAGFWQGVPAKYSSTTQKYPLIIFIHGIGELGTNLTRMNCCGLPRHMSNKTFPANFNVGGTNFSFLVIAPQFKSRPSAAQVQSVVDFAKRRWRVDASRVYVTGLSMGGGSTWDWSAVYGQNAAAIVPVCGGTKPTTTMAANIAKKNLPIWGLYSTADYVVPAQWGRNFFSWIDSRNTAYASRTKLTMWTDASHNSTWARAFNPATKVGGYNIYQWMLLNKRGAGYTPAPAPTPTPAPSTGTNKVPIAKAGSDKTIYLKQGVDRVTLNGTGSYDPDGSISAYSWTKISGPGASLYTFGKGLTYAARLTQGKYIFRVTVTDNKGARAYDDVVVNVVGTGGTGSSTSGNLAPVARAGANKTIYYSRGVDRVTLDATSSSDPDGSIVRYSWSKTSGPRASLYTFGAGKTYAAHLVKGTYVFKVTVTDNKGRTASDDLIVYVR
jgi:dienelactone hydrolase